MYMRKDVLAGNVDTHIRDTPEGPTIKLDVNSGFCAMDMRVCVDETDLAFSWREQ